MTPTEFNRLYSPGSTQTSKELMPVALPTDTKYRAATFIETYTGRAFWPLNPSVLHLSVIDIAHALSNQGRYSGHTRFFYSVAHHCCLLAIHVEKRGGTPLECLETLMHDSPEAYLVDIPRPVKQYMPQYREWDHAIDAQIRIWMNWTDPRPSFLDDLDSRIIVDERAALMSNSGNDWGKRLDAIGVDIQPWTPQEAEKAFLALYAKYTKQVYGFHNYINYAWDLPAQTLMHTATDMALAVDVLEVDIRGRVARMCKLDEDGIRTRDKSSGSMPEYDWYWEHGDFTVYDRAAAA